MGARGAVARVEVWRVLAVEEARLILAVLVLAVGFLTGWLLGRPVALERLFTAAFLLLFGVLFALRTAISAPSPLFQHYSMQTFPKSSADGVLTACFVAKLVPVFIRRLRHLINVGLA